MKIFYSLLLLITVLSSSMLFAQDLPTLYVPLDSSKLTEFRDTIYDFAFDSLTCNMVNMPQRYMTITKKFKYLGHAEIEITRAWTGDPHYICDYPKEPLKKCKIYTFNVCFSFKDRKGPFKREMGFDLSNEQRIVFTFRGNVQE